MQQTQTYFKRLQPPPPFKAAVFLSYFLLGSANVAAISYETTDVLVLSPSMQDNERSGIDQINAHKSSYPPVDHTMEGATNELKAVLLKRRKELVSQ